MQQSRAKTIKGLSIGCIVLSAIYLLAFVIGGAALAAVASYSGPIADLAQSYSPSYSYGYSPGGHDYSFGYGSPYDYDYSYSLYDDALDSQYLYLFAQLGIIFIVIGFVMQAVSLVSAIIVLLNASKPEKLGLAFGWGIAGAVISVFSGGIVQTVLFVLIVVFAYKDRQLYRNGQYPMPATVSYGAPEPIPVQPNVAPAENVSPVYEEGVFEATSPVSQAQVAHVPQVAPDQTAQAAMDQPEPGKAAIGAEEIVATEVRIHPEGNVNMPDQPSNDANQQ